MLFATSSALASQTFGISIRNRPRAKSAERIPALRSSSLVLGLLILFPECPIRVPLLRLRNHLWYVCLVLIPSQHSNWSLWASCQSPLFVTDLAELACRTIPQSGCDRICIYIYDYMCVYIHMRPRRVPTLFRCTLKCMRCSYKIRNMRP